MPNLLSWVQIFQASYNELVCMYPETHQHYNLETVGSTDYGTVDPGVYDVDDTAEMC